MSDSAETLHRQAEAFRLQGRRREAIDSYRRLLALRSDLTDCWYNLAYLLKADGQYDAALGAYGEALARGVQGPEEVHLNRAVIYADHLRREDAAQAELEAALKLNPAYAPALLNLGNLHEENGERDDAVACYERIVSSAGASQSGGAHKIAYYEAIARLVHLRPPETSDAPLLSRLNKASRAPADIDSMTRANLFFSLGRAYDGLGDYDQAFAAITEANRHARLTGAAYDRPRAAALTEALIAAFPPAGNAVKPEVSGAPTPPAQRSDQGLGPVFICGMFRSGSTLVEQVLSSHERITAGGELDILDRMTKTALAPFPESMERLGNERSAELARDYRAQLKRLFPDADRHGHYVTDKRPDNFLLIGLIKRLFPAAKIVHTVRNPLDNALSIYFQHIDQTYVSYSSDLDDIAHYQGQYRRLMAHWRSLYPDSILDFDYDAFVQEPRPAVERLLAFLGLDWDENCLSFHRRRNTVKTASYWQVREPLYTAASGRWRNYEVHLAPLRRALVAEGVLGADETL